MSEISSAPAEVAASEVVVAEPNPISVDNVDHEAANLAAQEKAKPPVKAEDHDKVAEKPKPLTAREALEKATKSVDQQEKPREINGQFKGKEGDKAPEPAKDPGTAQPVGQEAAKAEAAPVAKQPHDEPPARFSADAKASWATVPEPARAETHRALRELESGIEEHRKQWEPIKPYADMAKQYGTTVDSALERYVSMDKLLNEDLGRGLESIVRDKTGGQYGLKDVIAQITGQKPEQAQSESAATIHRLEQKIGQLEKQIGGVNGHLQQQTMSTIDQHVSEFAKDKPHFERLSPQIAEHIRAGQSLEQAYQTAVDNAQEMAKSLGFIPQAAAPSPAPAPSAQTDRGQKSITGAPGAGSAPATDRPSSSIQDAVRKAMQAAG